MSRRSTALEDPRPVPRRLRSLVPAALALVVAACAGGGTPPATATNPPDAASATVAPSASAAASQATEPVALTVGLGFIPSVQFAQFYLADQSGAYEDAGLTVELQNKIDPDLITLLGQGAVDIGSGDGTSVIPAVSQGIPVVYTSTIYGQFPSVVLAKAGSGITSAADLAGKRIGIPGRYGSSWIMLQALLQSVGLTPEDVTIVEFPDFGQLNGLVQDQVDAATGFANNEPIQLRRAGFEPVVLRVDDVVPLPGPGLVTGTATLESKEAALRAFTAATLDAMQQIADDPQSGLDATFQAVPDLAADPDLQREILDATIETWSNPRTGAPFGTIDRDGWQQSLDFMEELGLVPNAVTVDQLVDESLLP
jgi:NitT/TauT family transport system substrate-binding protein